jgi:hypothetical protein
MTTKRVLLGVVAAFAVLALGWYFFPSSSPISTASAHTGQVVKVIEAGKVFEVPDLKGVFRRCTVEKDVNVNPQSILATLKVIHICADDNGKYVLIFVRKNGFVGHEANLANLEAGLEAEKKREHDRLFAKRNN